MGKRTACGNSVEFVRKGTCRSGASADVSRACAVYGGILAFAVGDALGVPVEFSSREERMRSPVTGMRAYGTHQQPAGTWSDDTSMTLCTLESLSQSGITREAAPEDMMQRFCRWMREGYWTPYGEVFDMGGTTFTALAQSGDSVQIAHVGDSRAYLMRNGAIMRLTTDHTLVEEMVLKGLITPREAKYHPKRNYITRALGTAERVKVDLIQVEIRPGDVFFLCSDGLSNHVEDHQLQEITSLPIGWPEKLEKLVKLALDNGGNDNITAMYAVFEEDHK